MQGGAGLGGTNMLLAKGKVRLLHKSQHIADHACLAEAFKGYMLTLTFDKVTDVWFCCFQAPKWTDSNSSEESVQSAKINV